MMEFTNYCFIVILIIYIPECLYRFVVLVIIRTARLEQRRHGSHSVHSIFRNTIFFMQLLQSFIINWCNLSIFVIHFETLTIRKQSESECLEKRWLFIEARIFHTIYMYVHLKSKR